MRESWELGKESEMRGKRKRRRKKTHKDFLQTFSRVCVCIATENKGQGHIKILLRSHFKSLTHLQSCEVTTAPHVLPLTALSPLAWDTVKRNFVYFLSKKKTEHKGPVIESIFHLGV